MRSSISNARQVVLGNFELTFSEIQRLRFKVLSKPQIETKICGCKLLFLDNFFTNISAYLLLTIVKLLMMNMTDKSFKWFNPDELSIAKNYMVRNNYEFLSIYPDISKKLLALLYNIMGETDRKFETEVEDKLQHVQHVFSRAIETNAAEDYNQLNIDVGDLCATFISYIDSYVITVLGLEINCQNLDEQIIQTVDFMKRCKNCHYCRIDTETCQVHAKLLEQGVERVTFVFGDRPLDESLERAKQTLELLKRFHKELYRIRITVDVRLIDASDCMDGKFDHDKLVSFLLQLKQEFPIKIKYLGNSKSSNICRQKLLDYNFELES